MLSAGGDNSSVLTVANPTPGTTYTVGLQLCNFMGQCSYETRMVSQKAAAVPDVEIETLVDVTQVKPSDRSVRLWRLSLPDVSNTGRRQLE